MDSTERAVEKINQLLSQIAGCQIEYKPVHAIDQSDWHEASLQALMTDPFSADYPRFINGKTQNAFGFPIMVSGNLAGLAVVKGWPNAMPEELLALSELMTSVLEYRVFAKLQLDNSTHLETMMMLQENPENVTNIRPTRLSVVRQMREDLAKSDRGYSDFNSEEQSSTATNKQLGFPMLIQANSEIDIMREALDLHEFSGNWALLPLEDLAAGTLASREELKALGNATIFIRDLTQLNAETQNQLADYLAIQPSSEMPQIVAGLKSSVDRQTISPRLMKMFSLSTSRLSAINRQNSRLSLESLNPDLVPVH